MVRRQGRAVKGRLVDVEEPPAEGRESIAATPVSGFEVAVISLAP